MSVVQCDASGCTRTEKVAKDLLIVQNVRLGGVAIMGEKAIHALFVDISIWKASDFFSF